MTMTGLRQIDETVHLTHSWLKEIMDEADIDDRQAAYRALRLTFHAIRDRLPVDAAAHLSAQLPLLLRGIFFEGWRPASTLGHVRSVEDFLEPIDEGFNDSAILDGETAARAVIAVMARRISEGEIRHVQSALPRSLRDLFD